MRVADVPSFKLGKDDDLSTRAEQDAHPVRGARGPLQRLSRKTCAPGASRGVEVRVLDNECGAGLGVLDHRLADECSHSGDGGADG